MHKIRIWWENWVKTIEDSPIPLGYYALGFVAAIYIENFLEIFSIFPKIPFKLFAADDISFFPQAISIALWHVHCLLWWVTMILAMIIIMAVAGRRPIAAVTRFVLSFSLTVVLVPIIDLIVSGGKGISIHYINPTQGLAAFLPSKGVTYGEFALLEIMTVVSVGYLLLKRTSYFRTLLALAAISAVTVALFTLNYLAIGVFKFAALNVAPSAMPTILTRLFCIALWGETIIFLFLFDRETFKNILASYAWRNLIPIALFFILGIALARHGAVEYIEQNLLTFILSLIVISNAWLLYNFKPKANGTLWAGVYFLAALTALCALAINFITFFILIPSAAIILICRLKPWRINRIRVLARFINAGVLYLVMLLGQQFAGSDIAHTPAIFNAYFLIMPGLFLNFLDLDASAEDKNILALFGAEAAKTFCALMIFIAFTALPFVFLDKTLLFFMVPAGAYGAFLCFKRGPQTPAIVNLFSLTLAFLIFWLQWF